MPDLVALPSGLRAYLFDMDGVLTDTARLHAGAWKRMFDDALRVLADRDGVAFTPFDVDADYHRHVDGRPRYDGIRAFLASRGITLPDGPPPGDDDPGRHDPEDPSGWTVRSLGDLKNAHVQELLADGVVDVYPGSVAFVDAVRAAGARTAVVSSSANAEAILAAGGIRDRFDVVVDGRSLVPRGLRGKPAPDGYLAAAEDLGAGPDDAVVFEDAIAGVAAGRDGGFRVVVGVDRTGRADALRRAGAHVVVDDLSRLAPPTAGAPR
ncbi:MAG: beta-phosphoglucomutase family hydrolase [Solirubrobacteraceae bacterium]|nr:beta-phosphoglucomutase family hydrolase [Solirubrobacteraceae bacterium]